MKFDTRGLAHAGLDLVPPFSVEVRLDPVLEVDNQARRSFLHDSITQLEFQHASRILPGRRLSGVIVDPSGEEFFAKIFYAKGARRYWLRELAGADLFVQAK